LVALRAGKQLAQEALCPKESVGWNLRVYAEFNQTFGKKIGNAQLVLLATALSSRSFLQLFLVANLQAANWRS
jgi:hypothetical protein